MRRISARGFQRATRATAALAAVACAAATCAAACALPAAARAAPPAPPTAGTELAFGDNNDGQLGNSTNVGTTAPNPTPTAVVLPGSPPVAIAAVGGPSTIVATTSGQLYGFGSNPYGQLGVTADGVPHPMPMSFTLPVQQGTIAEVAMGDNDALAVTSTGQLFAFGANGSGQVGPNANSGTFNPNYPVSFTLPAQVGTVSQVAAGQEFSLALTSAGQLYGFGNNAYGELGNTVNNGNPTSANPTPTPIVLPGQEGQVSVIAAGWTHSLVATSAGQLYAFGSNVGGELGTSANNGTINPNPTPALVGLPGQSGQVTQLAGGQYFSLVLTSSGQLYAFGVDSAGQLGNGTTNASPNPTPTLVALPGEVGRITHIAAGENDALVVTSSGQLYGFGDNTYGQLATLGNRVTTPTPIPLPAGTTIDAVTASPSSLHTLALVGDLALATTSLPDARTGQHYDQTLQASGGAAPLSFALTGLPAGLSPGPAAGEISGTPTSAGTSTVTVTVTDADGLAVTKQLALRVAAASGTPHPPVLTRLKVKPRRFTAGARGAATITYTDSEAARTTFTVLAPGAGIRHGRSCVRPSARTRGHAKRCALALGTFTHTDRAGANSVRWGGRLHGRRLAAGSYVLEASATAAGLHGKTASTGFTIR